MSTQAASPVSLIESRVRRFYEHLNVSQFRECFQMIDPQVREDPRSVTLYQYMQSLGAFLGHHGKVEVRKVELHLHANEPSRRYHNRDFAVGKTTWSNQQGQEQVFQERWVKDGDDWYTVCTGFVAPGDDRGAPPNVLSHALDGSEGEKGVGEKGTFIM
jgi:hypothetical protein